MASVIDWRQRDLILPAFRQLICEKMDIIPFPHQADWWLASDGYTLHHNEKSEDGVTILNMAGEKETWAVSARAGGPARVVADLAAYKAGKSFGAAIWAASFASIPGAKVVLIGMEYDICSPEFDYLIEALCSDKGLGMKPKTMQNRPRDGKMWLTLENGAHFETRSWERRDSLKGKEVDAYVACEAYQFPGIEVFTSIAQNLRARKGYFVAPTTPDRPWVGEFYDRSQSGDPAFADWHCLTDIGAENNPFTFDQTAKDRDKQIMTREKFAIAYEGRLGDFVGRVFNYHRGERQFTPESHPMLWKKNDEGKPVIQVPDGWETLGGADTGTFYTGLIITFSPDGTAFVLAENPNYSYVAGHPERDEVMSIPAWAQTMKNIAAFARMRPVFWADANSQFKGELRTYGVTLLGNKTPFETRTEIAREYVQHDKVFFAPHLKILPLEMEWAEWPEDVSSAGRFARKKNRDHTLDCMEHILSKRPRSVITPTTPMGSWLASQIGHRKRERANFHVE